MSKELIERIEKFRERGCDTETHVLLCDCRDELTKQAEYKRKAEIWDYLYEAIEHTSRLSDELPDGTAGSSKEDIVNASLDVWREQQKKILALEGHIAKQAEQFQLFFEIADYAGFDIEERELSELPQAVAKLNERIAKQAEQIETLMMQLSACDVAALQNTHESRETRIPQDNPYYSAAYRSVCDAVDREISNREELTKQAEYIAGLQQTIRSMQTHYSVDACHKQLDEIDELKQQIAKQAERLKALEEYRDANEELVSTLLDSLEKIESHFSDKGELAGEGKWRLDSIYKAVQQANEAVDKCVAARKQSKLAAATKLIAKWSVQIDDKNNGRHTAAWAQLRICRDELAAVLNDSTGGKQ